MLIMERSASTKITETESKMTMYIEFVNLSTTVITDDISRLVTEASMIMHIGDLQIYARQFLLMTIFPVR